jgi:hypothetical protein
MQLPFVQVWPDAHAVPQAPQFDALVIVFTHALLQYV